VQRTGARATAGKVRVHLWCNNTQQAQVSMAEVAAVMSPRHVAEKRSVAAPSAAGHGNCGPNVGCNCQAAQRQ